MTFDLRFFNPDEVVIDTMGNRFIKRCGVARFLGCSIMALHKTHTKKGLSPLIRRVNGYVVFVPEDVKQYAQLRCCGTMAR
ncbi:hypothetical protein AAIR98_001340 [Elusimicrobium simillimum]|uniref:hypothetical protein n=1 Tax=Elusimicrobium simillimum TaxID=3143438 RepID=UPI003C6EF47C